MYMLIKEQCFFQYATSFMPGAAIIAGEILESLWSSLNAISPMAWTATLAHRAEMSDDHACDSNHKKTLGIVSSLCQSHRKSVNMLDHAKMYYQNLTDQASDTVVEKWTLDIEDAKCQCQYDISVINIYSTKLEATTNSNQPPASGMPKSTLELWMDLSLAVEEKQYVTSLSYYFILNQLYRLEIQAKVQQMGDNPSSTDWQTVKMARE